MSLVRIGLVLLLLCVASARAQTPSTTQPDDRVHVYLVTLGPGADVWEKFGHNMIWIHDPALRGGDVDVAYNWGMFNFDSFIFNFLRKNMRYWMEAFRYQPLIEDYIAQDRSAWVQELNLSDAQKEELMRRLDINLLPKNKFYDYDYYTDNCSTRVRDAIDGVLGGEIRRTLEPQVTSGTFRWHTRRLMADAWFFDLALDFVLGPYADRKINKWDECFLPVQFMKHARTVQTANGPLVLGEQTLHISSRFGERDAPPNRFVPYLILGVLVGTACAAMGLVTNVWGRRALMTAAFAWCALGVVGGVCLTLLWFATPHVPPKGNQNLLQLNPLFLILLGTIPLLRRPRARMIAFRTAAVVLGLSVLGLLLKPFTIQHNADILAMTLTANTGLAVGLYLLTKRVVPEKSK